MLPGYRLETVDLSRGAETRRVAAFLDRFGLGFDAGMDMTVIVVRDDAVVGTGSFRGEVLRNFAVDESLQGEGLTAAIADALMAEQARRGILHRMVYTSPASATRFADLGFREIARAEPWAVLLESGIGSVDTYLDGIAKTAARLPPERAAVVVNCNPFTRGHRWLLETAAREAPGLVVFVVSEDRSLFPFRDRLDLVTRGVADLPNVVVVPTGIYMVSSATFPTYFTREGQLAAAQAHLDIALFAGRIAPRLGIKARYVGEEPYCVTTEAYNHAMRDLLPPAGVRHIVIPRLESAGAAISASSVRDLIRRDDWEGVRALVPDVTWNYLRSPERAGLIARIRASDSRH